MTINKYKVIKILRTNYELIKEDSYFEVGFEILLKHLIWLISEKLDDKGEFVGGSRHTKQKFWSGNAIERFNQNKNKGEKNSTKGLKFEHVVPLNLIKECIRDMFKDSKSDEEIIKFLNTYLVICVITVEEDEKLNKAGYRSELGIKLNKNTIWNRYKNCNIEVYNTEVYKEGRRNRVRAINQMNY